MAEFESKLDEAMWLLDYALNLRIYGEDHLVGSQNDWDSRCETFLRKNYTGYNETPTTERFNMTEKNEPETVVYDITDAAPTMEPTTRKKVKKVAALGVLAAGVLLLADDQVKKFRDRKNVTVTVTENDETDDSSTSES